MIHLKSVLELNQEKLCKIINHPDNTVEHLGIIEEWVERMCERDLDWVFVKIALIEYMKKRANTD